MTHNAHNEKPAELNQPRLPRKTRYGLAVRGADL